MKDFEHHGNGEFGEYNLDYESGESIFSNRMPVKKTINQDIFSLSDIFVEWYLYDSSKEKSIPEFLKKEQLDDVLTEENFMKLISKEAYLSEEAMVLVQRALPFRVNLSKLYRLNREVEKTWTEEIIPDKERVLKKIKESEEKKKIERKKNRAQVYKCYYEKNKEKLKLKGIKYREENCEKLKLQWKLYRENHAEEIKNYWQSDAGKKVLKRYASSEKGKKVSKKYTNSEKGKATKRKYQQSEKGKSAKRKYQQSERGKALRKLRNEEYAKSDKRKVCVERYRLRKRFRDKTGEPIFALLAAIAKSKD